MTWLSSGTSTGTSACTTVASSATRRPRSSRIGTMRRLRALRSGGKRARADRSVHHRRRPPHAAANGGANSGEMVHAGRRSCATGPTSRSRWPKLSFLVTRSPTSCAVSTGSDRRQPRHERWHPVPSGRRRQDRCTRTGSPARMPFRSTNAATWSPIIRIAAKLVVIRRRMLVERFRVTLNGWEGSIWGIPARVCLTDKLVISQGVGQIILFGEH